MQATTQHHRKHRHDATAIDKALDYFSMNDYQKTIIKSFDAEQSFIHLQSLFETDHTSLTITDIVSQLEEVISYSKKAKGMFPNEWQSCGGLFKLKSAIAHFIKEGRQLIIDQLKDSDHMVKKSELELLTSLLVNKDFEVLVRSIDAGNNVFPGMLSTKNTQNDAGIIRAVLTTPLPATDWNKSWFGKVDWTLERYLKERAIDHHPHTAQETLIKLLSPDLSTKNLQVILAHGKGNSRGASLGKVLDETFVFYNRRISSSRDQVHPGLENSLPA